MRSWSVGCGSPNVRRPDTQRDRHSYTPSPITQRGRGSYRGSCITLRLTSVPSPGFCSPRVPSGHGETGRRGERQEGDPRVTTRPTRPGRENTVSVRSRKDGTPTGRRPDDPSGSPFVVVLPRPLSRGCGRTAWVAAQTDSKALTDAPWRAAKGSRDGSPPTTRTGAQDWGSTGPMTVLWDPSTPYDLGLPN